MEEFSLRRFHGVPFEHFTCVAPAKLPISFTELCSKTGVDPDEIGVLEAHRHILGDRDQVISLLITPRESADEVWVRFATTPAAWRDESEGEGEDLGTSAATEEPERAEETDVALSHLSTDEFFDLIQSFLPASLPFRCSAEIDLPSGVQPVVRLPIRLWVDGALPLGDLMGARFQLRRRGLSEAWAAIDVRDDDVHVVMSFKKTCSFSDVVESSWEAAVSALTAITVAEKEKTR